ncbi:RING/U-box superfamily protein [Euphorbia peplus]|nr:RING/U-box superfamily protein [Euphorbia peplus]
MSQTPSSSSPPIDPDSPSPSSPSNRDSSPASPFPEHHPHPHDTNPFGVQETDHQHIGFFRGNMIFVDDVSAIRDDTWSCVIVVLTFWFFISMTLILGVYGAVSVTIGPNSSVLIQPNPLFVQSIKVEELDSNPGLVLYGLYKTPSLDVVKPWSRHLNTSIPADSHKEWTYFMNEGSEINISYSVSPPSSSLFIIVAQGSEGLSQWLEDPTYPNTTLSWNVVHGSGMVQQKISTPASYYVAVGNLNTEDAKVELKLNINALLYNTNEAYYKCTFTNSICSLRVLFPNGNSVILSSPGSEDESSSDEWYIKVSYGPRWATYVVGIATMTVLMLGAFNFLNKIRCMRDEETGVQYSEGAPERAPLLSYKDDDVSSWGSSYDSVSNDDEDLENFLAANSMEGKSSRDSENGNNTRRLCAICFDAPRDCFFLPCGHCVACFECGTRIVEASGTCPVCRRNMKKVRKIFTV